jgi:hypothetical protein
LRRSPATARAGGMASQPFVFPHRPPDQVGVDEPERPGQLVSQRCAWLAWRRASGRALTLSRSGLAFEVADFLGLGCGASPLALEFLGLGCGALLRAVEFLLRLPLALFLSASPLERPVTGQVAYGLLRTSRQLVQDADGSSFSGGRWSRYRLPVCPLRQPARTTVRRGDVRHRADGSRNAAAAAARRRTAWLITRAAPEKLDPLAPPVRLSSPAAVQVLGHHAEPRTPVDRKANKLSARLRRDERARGCGSGAR